MRLDGTRLLCGNFMRPYLDSTSARSVRPVVRKLAVVLSLAVASSQAGWAAEDSACPFDRAMRLPPAVQRPASLEGPVFVSAEQLEGLAGGVSEFAGNVELTRGEGRLRADKMRYDRASEQTDAWGAVVLTDGLGDRFETSEAHLKLPTRTGYAGPGTFALVRSNARGDARRADFEGPTQTRLSGVRYTTCAPGQDSWYLHAGELELDTAEDIGTAYNAWLEFQGVPIFYFPYINFPISDQRKSGFLPPAVGYSDKRGYELATPYYFNLAPNYDDTLTPRLLTDRGLQLQNEFRHLGRGSTTRFDAEFLYDDRVYGDNRYAAVLLHRNQLTRGWSANLDLRGVSDDSYLNDFSDNINLTSQTHLPRLAEAFYRGRRWNFTARAAGYQTIDPAIAPSDRPYMRLPQLALNASDPPLPNRPQLALDGEWVNFQRSDSVTGARLGVTAGAALPFSNSYAFLTPRASARGIAYALDDTTGGETSPSVASGVLSVDSGLFFEREAGWGGRGYLQTLEPRLYYLYVPYQNQDDQPNFDTSVPDLSFLNLFRDNRFVGGDRVGDANQLTVALTTRLLDDQDGVERLRASLGQIVYFADRRVGLPASGSQPGASTLGVDDAARSNPVAELAARLIGNWYAQATAEVDEQSWAVQRHGAYLQYQPAPNRIFMVGERYTRYTIKQTDFSFQWPIGARWTALGRSIYSQFDHRNVDSYLGLEYSACCWALRVFATQRYDADDDRQITSVQLQLQLAGLSKIGGAPQSPLTQGLFFTPGARDSAPTPSP
jgi:LPS-assembly protein